MEPMVVCAVGIVVYCGYLTVKDIVSDLFFSPLHVTARNRDVTRFTS